MSKLRAGDSTVNRRTFTFACGPVFGAKLSLAFGANLTLCICINRLLGVPDYLKIKRLAFHN